MSAVRIRTRGGEEATVSPAAMDSFRADLTGTLIGPGDTDYDTARKVYNGMIDRRPGLIVQCANTRDVIRAVNMARDQGSLLSVRGGSHNVAGFAVCDGGIVIDLSCMRSIDVDPAGARVRVDGGCTWADVDQATHPYKMATPGGVISTTGVGGLTLGGGFGHLTRKYGLCIDNLLSAEVVTADGRSVTASAAENSDLFWAIRGGGGNFGIVTSFEFRLHPVDTVYAGPIFYPFEKTAEAMRLYRQFIAEAPEDVTGFLAIMLVPPAPPFPEELHNRLVCGVVPCYLGPQENAERALRPLLEFGPPLFAHVGPMPYPALQSAFDGLLPPGLQHYWKADFDRDISDEAIQVHIEHGAKIPTFQSVIHIYPLNGAVHRVAPDETAFSYRDANFTHILAAVYTDPADAQKNRKWVRDYFDALHPFSMGGAYVNFLMDEADEGQDRIRSTYRGNYDRLAKLKAKYDPTNLFCTNQNIAPAG